MTATTGIVISAVEARRVLCEAQPFSKPPFICDAWLGNWLETYAHTRSKRRPFVVVVRDELERLTGILPAFVSSTIVGGRTVQFIGDGEVCTDYQTIICKPGHEHEVCLALGKFLTANHDLWDTMVLDAVDQMEPAVSRLCQCMAELGNTVQQDAAMQCWRFDLPAQWEDVVGMMSKPHRKHMRKVSNRLLSHPDFRVHFPTDEAGLKRSLEALIDLHQKRWTVQGEAGCFASSDFTRFIVNSTADLFSQGRVFAPWISFEGTPVAADLSFVADGGLFAYQTGISPDHLKLQPGRAMNMVTLQLAIKRGYGFIDYLRGDEAYKAKWRAKPRPMLRYRITPARLSACVRKNLQDAGTTLKQVYRQLLPSPFEPAPAS